MLLCVHTSCRWAGRAKNSCGGPPARGDLAGRRRTAAHGGSWRCCARRYLRVSVTSLAARPSDARLQRSAQQTRAQAPRPCPSLCMASPSRSSRSASSRHPSAAARARGCGARASASGLLSTTRSCPRQGQAASRRPRALRPSPAACDQAACTDLAAVRRDRIRTGPRAPTADRPRRGRGPRRCSRQSLHSR